MNLTWETCLKGDREAVFFHSSTAQGLLKSGRIRTVPWTPTLISTCKFFDHDPEFGGLYLAQHDRVEPGKPFRRITPPWLDDDNFVVIRTNNLIGPGEVRIGNLALGQDMVFEAHEYRHKTDAEWRNLYRDWYRRDQERFEPWFKPAPSPLTGAYWSKA